MEQGRFYYSINRTEVRGPVTWGILQQLFQDGIIGEGTRLCRETETDWYPLNPEAFRISITQGVVAKRSTKPPGFVPPPDGYVQSRLGQEIEEVREWSLTESLGVAIALGAAAYLAAATQPPVDTGSAISYKCGAFVGLLVLFTVPPYLLSLFFEGFTRRTVRLIGILVLVVLTIAGRAHGVGPKKAEVEADPLKDEIQTDARK